MEYGGRHPIFDPSRIQTQPLRGRANKVHLDDLLLPEAALDAPVEANDEIRGMVEILVHDILTARRAARPVILFTGAHLIKNGLGPLLADLVRRGAVTLVAGNAATAIHDFELALIGQTSEDVPEALGKGRFGMAYEFSYINAALALGDELGLGFGESLGRMIGDPAFRDQAFAGVVRDHELTDFPHSAVSVIAACRECGVPMTIHAGIGTDVIDQHPSFDGRAKGGCSGRDFLIYVRQVAELAGGGVVLNVGSAVTGPEILLKAVSMAANAGSAPRGLIAADLDLREHLPTAMSDPARPGYYFRDQKSVVTRVPEAFGGRGCYIQGDQRQTFVLLYQLLRRGN